MNVVFCRSSLDGEDDVVGLCCHLEEQVRSLHTRVCEALQRKYNSVLRCDDHTANLSDDVIVQFAVVKPIFEHLEKVSFPSEVYLKKLRHLVSVGMLLNHIYNFWLANADCCCYSVPCNNTPCELGTVE